MLRIETLRCWGAFKKRCRLEPTNQEIVKIRTNICYPTQCESYIFTVFIYIKKINWLMYDMFGFPLCCNISIIQTKLCFRCHIFFFQSQKSILPHWPAFATHDGAMERYSMVQSAGGCGAGFLYSIAPKQINGDLGCIWLVGWWGGWWW